MVSLKVGNDILMNMDMGHVTLQVLLDVSAAFDTVDHDILIYRLQSLLCGSALQWFRSHLRTSYNEGCSFQKVRPRMWGASGFIFFTIYARKLFSIIKSHLPYAHSYADDTQLYLLFRPLESTREAEALMQWRNISLLFVHG